MLKQELMKRVRACGANSMTYEEMYHSASQELETSRELCDLIRANEAALRKQVEALQARLPFGGATYEKRYRDAHAEVGILSEKVANLRECLQDSEAEVDGLRDYMEELKINWSKATMECALLREQVEALRNALHRFGSHDPGCLCLTGGASIDRPCDCGYARACGVIK